jgi:hypothetical protein
MNASEVVARSTPWRTLALAMSLLAVLALALEVYMRWPSSATLPPLSLDADTRYVVILVHGSHGSNEPAFIEMEQRFNEGIGAEPGVAIIRLIWAPHDTRSRSYVHGRRIGAALGRELATLPELRDIRLIGHSAGAYFMDPICASYRENAVTEKPAYIEMTFLDGIGIRGGWDYNWGYRNHGSCADFARSIYNADDRAPGHNQPYDHAANIDVTQSPGKQRFDRPGHYYPLQYFLDHLGREEMQPRRRSHSDEPRGSIVIATD